MTASELQEAARSPVACINIFSRVRLTVPVVRIRKRDRSCYWQPTKRRKRAAITISLGAHSHIEHLAHELAHHMAYHLSPMREVHGEFFFRCLRIVVDVMGLDSYDWSKEYRAI